VYRVPGDTRVDEDQAADSGEHLSQAWLQFNPTQRVHTQVKEVQIGDVRHNRADLATQKTDWRYYAQITLYVTCTKYNRCRLSLQHRVKKEEGAKKTIK
jgi:hypothetical protein